MDSVSELLEQPKTAEEPQSVSEAKDMYQACIQEGVCVWYMST